MWSNQILVKLLLPTSAFFYLGNSSVILLFDVTSQVLVLYIHNLEETLLQISVSICPSNVRYFSSLRTQISHRRMQFHLIFTYFSEAVSLAGPPGDLQLSPSHHPGIYVLWWQLCIKDDVIQQRGKPLLVSFAQVCLSHLNFCL